ncbi:hypothetical protein GF357_00730 [Candidatus Dojkabacteria bacterium]|nr:hypothetical protein [Candidatus Dojkabacteria bacterium]
MADSSVSSGINSNLVGDSGKASEPTNSSSTATVPADPNSDPLVTEKTAPEDLDLQWSRWKCLNCGYVYEGSSKLTKCPRCGNEDPDKFQDAS